MAERADIKTRFSSERQPEKTGRPRGSRDKLSQDFLSELSADFEKHGAAAIRMVRSKKPADYLRVVASLQPKEIEIKTPESALSDEQVESLYHEMLARMAARKSEPNHKVN